MARTRAGSTARIEERGAPAVTADDPAFLLDREIRIVLDELGIDSHDFEWRFDVWRVEVVADQAG